LAHVRVVTTTFLLEIGTEELPADFARQALDQLRERVPHDLAEARLSHGSISIFGTPRRLVVSIPDLDDRQPDLREERKGPPVAQAFKDGVPGPAAIGFAKRCGIDASQLEQRDTPKGPCVFATVLTAGRDGVSLLRELIPNVD
jgi:glycyl-tRNA synthetase beta chain